MPPEIAFSELLREQRRAAGYSQEELAERAGLSVGAIAALEQGARRAPYRDTVSALANALGIPDSTKRRFEDVAARARRRVRRDDAIRLVTVTAPGDAGKTRIAIEVARRNDQFIELADVTDLIGTLLRTLVSLNSEPQR